MAKTAMKKETSSGICRFCDSEIEKGKMTQHLRYCKQRKASNEAANSGAKQQTRLFHILVEGTYQPMYWMHLEIPASATLYDLDGFLRAVWLECCDHLSEFRIGDMSYMSQREEMSWGIGDDLEAGEDEEEEDEDEEEEDDDFLFPGMSEALEHVSPSEAGAKLLEVLTEEFKVNPLALSPEEFDARLIELLTRKMEEDLKATLAPEQQEEIKGLVPMLRTSLMLTTDPLMSGMLDSIARAEEREKGMDVKLGKVLTVGQKFTHEYDFGSTTHLALRVQGERAGAPVEDEEDDLIAVMAMNIAPVIPCRECGKPAIGILTGYYNAGDGALCSACAKKPDVYGEYEEPESMLPVVNSPRAGVCGYSGSEDDWKELREVIESIEWPDEDVDDEGEEDEEGEVE